MANHTELRDDANNSRPYTKKKKKQHSMEIKQYILPISIVLAGLLFGGGIFGAALVNNNTSSTGGTPDQTSATEELTRFANELGVNEGEFTECLSGEAYMERVTQDAAEVPGTGTPHSILIAGETRVAFSGALPPEMVSSLIDPLAAGNMGTLQETVDNLNQEVGRELIEIGGSENVREVSNSDHIRGAQEADVYLVEYSDLQCPFCERFHSTAQALLEHYNSGSVRLGWVYRHHPLDELHPHATDMALASECVAGQQGNEGFWAYIDTLFENQELFSEAI